MSSSPRAAINLAMKLRNVAPQEYVNATLTSWMTDSHNVPLESLALDDLIVEWLTSDDPHKPGCHLVVSDAREGARRAVTLVADEASSVIFIEDAPLGATDRPHTLIDLSQPTQALVKLLADSGLEVFFGLNRTGINSFRQLDESELLVAISQELSPGLLIVVTPEDGTISDHQRSLAEALPGLAVALAAPVESASRLAGGAGTTGSLRPGSVISVARTVDGLDAQVVGGMSLRNQPDSARRLILRHQLAAPVPFSVERRRAATIAALVSGGHDLDAATALELLEEESHRANELNQRLNETEFTLQLAWEEQDSALAELDSALSRLRFLESAFRQYGEIPIGDPQPDDEWIPDTCFDSLMAAKELLPYLVITSSDSPALELDLHQKRSIWAKKIWSALRALNDYARAKADERFDGDLTRYREDPPSEAVPLLYEYAPKESASTSSNPQLRQLRMFQVATEVDSSGKAYMEQHVKIDKGGSNAPRIHLLDDSGGMTKTVYVGYVGPHLATSSGF